MFKIRYKSHHDVGNVISKFTKNFKASKEDFISLLEGVNVNKQLALYFHTPYCDKICSFCNMNRKQLDNDLEEYTKYICDEIKKYGAYKFCKTSEVGVVFFGGGTPTIFKKEQLEKILKTLRENFIFSKDYEMTFETTLHNLSFEKLEIMEKYGVNRISVGIQTFSDRGRKLLNRTYDKNYVVERLKEIKKRFSGLICIDIIYNYADQTDEEILEDARLLSEIKTLPNTGQSSLPLTGLAVGAAVLVVLLVSKKHRNKVLSVVLIGAMGQSIVMPFESFAFENKELVSYNTQKTIANSNELANGSNGITTLCPVAPIKTTLRILFLCFFDTKRTTRTAAPTAKPVKGRELCPVLGKVLSSDVGLESFL